MECVCDCNDCGNYDYGYSDYLTCECLFGACPYGPCIRGYNYGYYCNCINTPNYCTAACTCNCNCCFDCDNSSHPCTTCNNCYSGDCTGDVACRDCTCGDCGGSGPCNN